MENLDKLTAAGLPVYDLNAENIDRKDWSQTPLGPRSEWPASLQCLVSSFLLPIPHCAAIFWGDGLSIIHNLAWGKATGDLDGQGRRADDSYPNEVLTALHSAVRGRTVKVASRAFFDKNVEHAPDSTVLLSTLLDETGKRQGVLAQLTHNSIVERYMPLSHLDDITARQTKAHGAQQKDITTGQEQVDAKQTQLFQQFAELLPNGLAILDSDAEAVFVNDNFFKLTTNRSSNEFRAWPESIDSMDYERVMSEYRTAFSSRNELRIEFRCAGSNDEESREWRLFLLRPLSEHAEAGFICAIVDITEIKHAQIAQEKAATEAQERKEQQERFIDMVSHEIRNPLSAVLHLAEEIKEVAKEMQGAREEDVEGKIADIRDAADTILLCVSHQNTLVDDILSFSKLDSMMLSLVPREVRPKWEFSKALKVFNAEFKAKKINFHYAMDVSYDKLDVDVVVADLNRMKQVLVNLITNAIKFTSKKDGDRNITVSMGASVERPRSYPPNVIFFSLDDSAFHIDTTMTSEWGSGPEIYLMVAVSDTGIGISDDGQVKLFERFRQATPKTQENYGGSGLGLFISRKLCQLHGGDIGVSSIDGVGSTFGFFFKARRITYEGGRPSFPSRSTSENSVTKRATTPRPSYSRSTSLRDIKEKPNSEHRPKIETLFSHEGVDPSRSDNASLENPPTENNNSLHPSASRDEHHWQRDIAMRAREKRASFTSATGSDIIGLESQGETCRQEEAVEETAQSQKQENGRPLPTILLVEDNLINQKVLRRQLQSRGFDVLVANNGQEAINVVAERGELSKHDPDHPDYFDCILMDQEMPIKDGNSATVEIRELQEQGKAGRSPILGVSANAREAQRVAMKDAGMDGIISKPFKVDDLVTSIEKLMEKR
ncbi:two component histidine kinase 1 [Aaosphaeria arxii CBS 175.79]|uniref:histidine kinase n=1 Tax=Aaosphaeria arxii CBS 175.79 TaxID=1450172 RepID=A0A6A5XIU5_9PLEO|nr:two component histidine kinase 1 [Aaosphaeria arxii CBS 175.79]KAF2012779.1 two component histidine kinase 1 [Aaosphaeria arxii CBS 175.79]